MMGLARDTRRSCLSVYAGLHFLFLWRCPADFAARHDIVLPTRYPSIGPTAASKWGSGAPQCDESQAVPGQPTW